MRRFKIERLCTFKVLYRSNNMSRENKETIISLHLKRIKNSSHIANIIKKIFPNQFILSINPQNKRAKRLVANAKARNTVKYNQWKPIHYSTTSSTGYYTFTTSGTAYSSWSA